MKDEKKPEKSGAIKEPAKNTDDFGNFDEFDEFNGAKDKPAATKPSKEADTKVSLKVPDANQKDNSTVKGSNITNSNQKGADSNKFPSMTIQSEIISNKKAAEGDQANKKDGQTKADIGKNTSVNINAKEDAVVWSYQGQKD